MVFDKDGCKILDEEGNIVIQTENEGRLYTVRTNPEPGKNRVNVLQSKKDKLQSLELWHRRLMHVSKHQIIKMVNTDSVIGLHCEVTNPTPCDDCLTGKATRQPFPVHPSTGEKKKGAILDLVHSDLMGPIDFESFGGNRYVLTIIDDASRYVFIRLLKTKGEVLTVFKAWKSQVEKQTGKLLKRFRTDNGLEFCSKNWDTFCEKNGIVHEKTMTYSPQQNGIAERFNRTLMYLVRAEINESELPKSAWGELINTTAYIRNRVTNSHDNNKTPYELWVGRKPNVTHLRAIGCEVFVHVPKQKRFSKLTSRATKGLLLGYSLQGRGYRVWLPGTRQVIESHDCVFKEEITLKNEDKAGKTREPELIEFHHKEETYPENEERKKDRRLDQKPEPIDDSDSDVYEKNLEVFQIL